MVKDSRYERLLGKIGPFYPDMPDQGTPRSKEHPDWAAAERLYDDAQGIAELDIREADSVVDGLNEWLAELPDWYQQEIIRRIEKDEA
mgnify:CR=1 FL=1